MSRSFFDLRPGEGAVVEVDGEKGQPSENRGAGDAEAGELGHMSQHSWAKGVER